jgi:hypothetical protein
VCWTIWRASSQTGYISSPLNVQFLCWAVAGHRPFWLTTRDAVSICSPHFMTVREGISLGVTLIDMTEIYSNGEAERLISHVIAGQRDVGCCAPAAGPLALQAVAMPAIYYLCDIILGVRDANVPHGLKQTNRRFSIDITESRLAAWERAGEHLSLRRMRCVL